MRGYLLTRLVWVISAAAAAAAFGLARLVGLDGIFALIVAFLGAIAGSILGSDVKRRLQGPRSRKRKKRKVTATNAAASPRAPMISPAICWSMRGETPQSRSAVS